MQDQHQWARGSYGPSAGFGDPMAHVVPFRPPELPAVEIPEAEEGYEIDEILLKLDRLQASVDAVYTLIESRTITARWRRFLLWVRSLLDRS